MRKRLRGPYVHSSKLKQTRLDGALLRESREPTYFDLLPYDLRVQLAMFCCLSPLVESYGELLSLKNGMFSYLEGFLPDRKIARQTIIPNLTFDQLCAFLYRNVINAATFCLSCQKMESFRYIALCKLSAATKLDSLSPYSLAMIIHKLSDTYFCLLRIKHSDRSIISLQAESLYEQSLDLVL